MSLLNVQKISKSYGKLQVLSDVSFDLSQGQNLAIVGESGCGKTTLAKIIMRLVKPDAGNIDTHGGRIQMVFQDPYQSLDPLWNVRAICYEGLWNKQLHAQEKELRVKDMLMAVGLEADMLERYPHEFSGGQRQRIAIARGLLAEPEVLILDEAVSALDTLVQQQIMDLLKELKQKFNLSYIFISHNLRLVQSFSDSIIVMQEGKIVEEAPASMLLQEARHPYTRKLFTAAFNYT